MDNVIVLSRLNLVPSIDDDTPLIVLMEISCCHSISHVISRHATAFFTDVQNNPIGAVHDPICSDEWSIVAQYVNPYQPWTIPELQDAYNFLQGWEHHEHRMPHNEFTFGQQTPSDPTRLNACVLYSICKANGIQTNRNLTMYQMATLCQMVSQPESYSRTIIHNTISHVPKDGLMQLYLAVTDLVEEIPEPIGNVVREASNYTALEKTITTFNTKQGLRMRVHPRNYPDAIVLAALNFSIDISSAQDPIREYTVLYCDPSNYIPEDPDLQALVRCNPHIIRLDEHFNPLLPPDLYDENILDRMVRTEGYTNNDLQDDSAYTLLQTAYMSFTFYHGRQPGIINTRTPFLFEDVDDLDNDLVVCFGVQGGQGTMTAFRYTELGNLFKEHRNFVNPIAEDDTFPPIAITKLKNLCKMIRTGDTEEVIEERNMVYESIINTELFTDETQAKARELFEAYEQAEPDLQDAILDAVNKLFHLSMYMRGWLGEGEYPILRAPVDNQAIVDLNVTNAVIQFENACEELEEVGDIILDLPLLKYKAGEFHPITTEGSRTIEERIEVVKTGDDSDNYDSCIRLSSNLLAVSSYRYMDILGIPVPFQVDRLRDIS